MKLIVKIYKMQSAAYLVVCLSTTLTVVVSSSFINYCGSKICGNTNSHTFCQYPEGPSPNCVGYIRAGLSEDEKTRVISRLNRRRNEAADGKLRGLHSAGNMLKLRWVDELAREAQRWADQCRPPSSPEEHDMCRDLYSITVGQCVASVVGEAPGLRVESMVDIWYMQNMLYKGNASIYLPPDENSSFYGDFAQIMWAESYMVGCGRSRFMTSLQGRLRTVERLVCNLAPRGPPPSHPLWAPSAPAALCPTRSKRDNLYHALCDIRVDSTKINEVDVSMSLKEHVLLYAVLDIERNESINYLGSLDEIYLTRLAMATMENDYATDVYSNSMQRRDIVETKESKYVHTSNTRSNHAEEYTALYEIPTPLPSFHTTNKERKRITLFGRPKAYNMNELTDLDDTTDNNITSEEVTKIEKEFYAEYEFVESTEDNSKAIIKYTNVKEILRAINYDKIQTTEVMLEPEVDYIKKITTNVYINSSVLYESENNLNTDSVNLKISDNDLQFSALQANTSIVKRDSVEEYFADPETVWELQEALDRIEDELSTETSTERSQKVRRELRDSRADEIFDNMNGDGGSNRSLDQSPMYDMVLKYLPYLKHYDSGLLLQLANGAKQIQICTTFVILLVIINLSAILFNS